MAQCLIVKFCSRLVEKILLGGAFVGDGHAAIFGHLPLGEVVKDAMTEYLGYLGFVFKVICLLPHYINHHF